MPLPDREPILRQRIDDLATRLLIEGPSSEGCGTPETLLAELAAFGREAGEAGYNDAAGIANSLAAMPLGISELQAGLIRLQQALSEPPRESTPAAPPAPARSPSPRPLAEDPELVADFIRESGEHLVSIEQHILTLEREPANADSIHSAFRGFHTIKGLAGFLEFAPIQEVAHEVETALNMVREGKLAITPAVIDVILASVDYLRRSMAAIEAGGSCERGPGHDELLTRVAAVMSEQPGVASPEPVVSTESKAEAPPPPEMGSGRPVVAAESLSVRVDTTKLDYLVDMVGEMVIAQSLVRHHGAVAAAGDQQMHRDLVQLARITGEVQRTAMAMRMVPIGQLFQRAVRQVRDLSRKVGKEVELVTRGENTELDKTIAEELADPMMHMVRNSIDHGIEDPSDRSAAGKHPLARISLAAYHQGGQIVIEVGDDGRGLERERILAKAIQKGLVAEGARLSDAEIFRQILEPGFSTADHVTEISGRGVGMDVVRKQVEKLRGRIEIRSQAGVGTTFLLKLPLTLAIIDGLVVTVGQNRYIVPLFSVREMFRPAGDAIFTVRNRQEMALVRGSLLPVLRLYRRFNVVPRTEDPCQALLIVAESEEQTFCLMVDDLVGKQEVVIKSLGTALGEIQGVAGGAILGDGRVGLILDIGGLWGAHGKA